MPGRSEAGSGARCLKTASRPVSTHRSSAEVLAGRARPSNCSPGRYGTSNCRKTLLPAAADHEQWREAARTALRLPESTLCLRRPARLRGRLAAAKTALSCPQVSFAGSDQRQGGDLGCSFDSMRSLSSTRALQCLPDCCFGEAGCASAGPSSTGAVA